jgi:tetratricopeptide (TPR) repeat protein
MFMEEGKLANAEEMFRETISIRRGSRGLNQNQLLSSLLGLADCLFREGKSAESGTYVCEAISIEHNLTEDQRAQSGVAHYIGSLLQRLGDLAEAEYWYRQALFGESIYPRQPPDQYAQTVINLVTIHFPQKKFHELESAYPEWLQMARARLPADDPALADILAQMITAPLAEQKFDEAEKLAREYMAIYGKKLPNDWRMYEARSTLGNCLVQQKRYAEAEPLLVSGCEGLRQQVAEIPDWGKRRASEDLACLAQLYEATGRADLARQWNEKRQDFDRPAAPQQALRTDGPAASKQ